MTTMERPGTNKGQTGLAAAGGVWSPPESSAPGAGSAPLAASDLDVTGSVVLLVDDNEQNLELLLAYLEELGCELRTAADGIEALDSIAKKRPDLVVLDVMMPRMSGFQACAKIKRDAATRDIPVVMVTAPNE